MEMDKDLQRTAVTTAITVELQRQAETGAQRIDIEALADAVLQSIEPTGPATEGRRPDELNSSNDG